MTGDHTRIGGRGAQISADGACAAAGAASCARPILSSSSPHCPIGTSLPATLSPRARLAYLRLTSVASHSVLPHLPCPAAAARRSLLPCWLLSPSLLLAPLPPSGRRLLGATSTPTTESDEHLEPAHQPGRPPGVPGGQGERSPRRRASADARVGALRRTEHRGRGAFPRALLPEVAGADAAPGQQLRRRRARRDSPGAAVQPNRARLPAVAPGQDRRRRRGLRRGDRGQRRAAGTTAAAAGGAGAAGGRDLRRRAGRAPDRAHRAQDAPDHRVREPQDRERRRPVPHCWLRRVLRHRRLARHRPQRQGQARRAQEPRRLHRPERPRPWTPAPLIELLLSIHTQARLLRAFAHHHRITELNCIHAQLRYIDPVMNRYRTSPTTVFLCNVVVNRETSHFLNSFS